MARQKQEEFVMTLDSDDEVDVGSGSEAEEDSKDLEEESSTVEHGRKRKATLAEREKITDKSFKRKKTNEDEKAEMVMDKAFTFDTDDGSAFAAISNGWDMSVAGGSRGRGGVTVDDIIERRRTKFVDAPILDGGEDEVEEEEAEEEEEENDDDLVSVSDQNGEELQFTGFDVQDDSADEEVDEQESEEGSEIDDVEQDEDASIGDEKLSDGDGKTALADTDSEDESETEVEKAKKAAYFAAEPDVAATASSSSEKKATFQTLQLSRPVMRALSTLNFQMPTPIQAKSIPIALAGKDIVAGAVTGSGKTAAFLIPVLERLSHRPKGRDDAKTRVLILMPTRELAVQCVSVGRALAKFSDISFCLCVGGLSLKVQEKQLRERPDIVVATPGRLIDHIRNSASFGVEDVEILIMDEADRMMEEGFRAELDEIIKAAPKSRQTMLFSATMTDDVDELVRLSMKRPVRLFVDPRRRTAQKLVQEFVRVRGAEGNETSKRSQDETRMALLFSLCIRTFTQQVIIFVRSKKLAHQLRIVFGLLGLSAGELHGDLSQEQRLQSLQGFRDGKVDFLLATDLASRGLDIKGVQTVINYDMPAQLEMYLHRVGRTARAGRTGRSVTLVGEADRKMLKTVLKKSSAEQIRHRLVPSEDVRKMAIKLEDLRKEVEEVLQEEKEEKLIRQAVMEATKGENMIKHHDEIMSRPKRTWFVSADDKATQKDASKKEHEAKMGNVEKKKYDKYAGLSRKQRRNKQAREEVEAEEKEDRGKSRGINASIRAAKKANRPKELGAYEPSRKSMNGKKGKGVGGRPRKVERGD